MSQDQKRDKRGKREDISERNRAVRGREKERESKMKEATTKKTQERGREQ